MGNVRVCELPEGSCGGLDGDPSVRTYEQRDQSRSTVCTRRQTEERRRLTTTLSPTILLTERKQTQQWPCFSHRKNLTILLPQKIDNEIKLHNINTCNDSYHLKRCWVFTGWITAASLTSAGGFEHPSWWWQICWCRLRKCAFQYLTWVIIW